VNRIFANAFGRDPDFFAFYRSMQAYQAGLQPGSTRLLMSPTSDFFRFFNAVNGSEEAPSAGDVAEPQAPEPVVMLPRPQASNEDEASLGEALAADGGERPLLPELPLAPGIADVPAAEAAADRPGAILPGEAEPDAAEPEQQ
jgi:membrane protease subunit HflC